MRLAKSLVFQTQPAPILSETEEEKSRATDELNLEKQRIEFEKGEEEARRVLEATPEFRKRQEQDRKRQEQERELRERQEREQREKQEQLKTAIIIARSEGNEEVYLTPDLRNRHAYIVGKTRTGKTTLLLNMLKQDIEAGRGCGYIDPHLDATKEVISFIPKEREKNIVLFDIREPMAFNILDCKEGDEGQLVSDFIITFKRLFGESWGVRMEHILRYSLYTLLKSKGKKTLLDLRSLLSDPAKRKQILSTIEDEELLNFWRNDFPNFPKDAAMPILNRLSSFLLPDSRLRNIISSTENKFDFDNILNNNKILLVSLTKEDEEASQILGAMIVSQIQMSIMRRMRLDQKHRKPFYLYVDEFQNYIVSSFETILSESSKYNLNLTMANQYIHQLPQEIQRAVFGNVGTIISFQVSEEDASYLRRTINHKKEWEEKKQAWDRWSARQDRADKEYEEAMKKYWKELEREPNKSGYRPYEPKEPEQKFIDHPEGQPPSEVPPPDFTDLQRGAVIAKIGQRVASFNTLPPYHSPLRDEEKNEKLKRIARRFCQTQTQQPLQPQEQAEPATPKPQPAKQEDSDWWTR